MAEEYRTKIFKSRGSLALRLPEPCALKVGDELTIREEGGRYFVAPIVQAKSGKIDLTGIAGTMSGLRPRAQGSP